MCDVEVIGDPSWLRLIRKVAALVRVFPTFDLICEENVGAVTLCRRTEVVELDSVMFRELNS